MDLRASFAAARMPGSAARPAGQRPGAAAARTLELVAAMIDRYRLLGAADRVLVAFSGGPDSTACALALADLGHEVVLGHVDHGMRPGSGDDAARCREIASRLGVGIETRIVRVDPPTEAEARQVRYAALEEMAEGTGAGRIATGHTMDDQAETVLMRLARGGYPMGIRPLRGRVVRPLLEVRHRDTEALCRERGIAWLADPTNEDERFARNRVRRRVMPELGDEAVAALARLGEAAFLTAGEVRRRSEAVLAGIVRPGPAGAGAAGPGERLLELDRGLLLALPPGLVRPLVRAALERVGLEPGSRLVADVAARVVPVTGARLDLPGGRVVWAEPSAVVVGRPAPPLALRPFGLAVPGRTRSREWEIEVAVDEVPAPGDPAASPDAAYIDAAALDAPLAVRRRRPGDRYRPLGGPGSKKLQDLFVDLKLPRAARDRVPVVVCGERIVWVPGARIDESFRLRERTRTALRVRIFPLLQASSPRP